MNASSTCSSVTVDVASAAEVGEVGVLGADARVVEPGRHRLRFEHLTPLVLQQVAERTVHDAGDAVADGGAAGRLDADELDMVELREAAEDAGRVGPAADAGGDDVGIARRRAATGTAHGPRRRARGAARAPSTGTDAVP